MFEGLKDHKHLRVIVQTLHVVLKLLWRLVIHLYQSATEKNRGGRGKVEAHTQKAVTT
jgi:hypothetical protein